MKHTGLLLICLLKLEVLPLPAAESAQPTIPSGEQHTNRLAGERSPYLLQHAHNPVDWYPWGEEAFARARREDKPIFLSVGYSTCHWCHVMERESFENPEIARILNEHFVCIKVDREERPDVDRIYMAFVQATTGGGGWPMNVWLTPKLKPFFGGTYFPPEQKLDLPAFPVLLKKIADAWQKDHDKLVQQADSFVNALEKSLVQKESDPAAPNPSLLSAGFEQIAESFDGKEGGFGKSPKFPRPVALNFLFQLSARDGTNSKSGARALAMNLLTLQKMAAGGIHDQLGGGFHRYAVDRFWHVPHFEKMLYDQAQLARSYLDALQITGDPTYERVARDILDYVRRDLTDPGGGFYSAEDADSLSEPGKPERSEGAFYLWKADQIESVLGRTNAAVFNYCHGVKPDGNAPEGSDPHQEFTGKNILIQKESALSAAAQFALTVQEIDQILHDSRQRLLSVRAARPRPRLDDKIITAWNGLMISAFARAFQVLEDPLYLQAATRSATFLRDKLYDPANGRLIRSYRLGASAAQGFIDDYAFLIQGLLDLYEASFDIRWLRWAIQLQEKQDALFWDARDGGYFSMGEGDKNILVRMKEDYDGAEPSPNSISALNLLRLSQMTGHAGWRERAKQTLAHFGGRLRNGAANLPQMLVAVDWYLSQPKQIVLAGRGVTPETRPMWRALHRRFMPNRIILLADGGDGQEFLAGRLEFIKGMKMQHGRMTAYVCENYVCQLPTDDPATFEKLLAPKR